MAFMKLIEEKKRKMNLKPNTLLYVCVVGADAYSNEMALKGEVIKIHFQRLYDPVLCFPLYRRFIHEIFYVLPLQLLQKISSNQIEIIFFCSLFCFKLYPINFIVLLYFFFYKQIEFLLRFVTLSGAV